MAIKAAALVAPAAPAVPSTVGADIAAFLAEGHRPDDGDVSGAVSGEGEGAEPDEVSDEGGGDPEADGATAEPTEEAEPAEEDSEEAAPAGSAIDGAALAKAVEGKDIAALLKAMGPAAEEMLTSKAHITLRRQLKDIEAAQGAAKADQEKASALATGLGAKYGDPIAARKAAEAGDANAFIDLVEKWGGHDWNTMQRWVANVIGGRPARLEAKAKEETEKQTKVAQKRDVALAEAKTWVSGVLNKSDATLVKECPEIVDLCIDEIRNGHGRGVDTPAKALPLAKKRLQEQHARLSRYFAVKGKKPTQVAAAKVGKTSEPQSTRKMSVEELIAETVKEERGRR